MAKNKIQNYALKEKELASLTKDIVKEVELNIEKLLQFVEPLIPVCPDHVKGLSELDKVISILKSLKRPKDISILISLICDTICGTCWRIDLKDFQKLVSKSREDEILDEEVEQKVKIMPSIMRNSMNKMMLLKNEVKEGFLKLFPVFSVK